MQVVSTNRAGRRLIEYRGKEYATGIFKTPTREALRVTCAGVEGDAVCDLNNHGGVHKAVYAFSIGHYPYWRQKLGQATLDAGAFGENLTFSDLPEEDICIGDQLHIGNTLLQVSQPRVPCFKLGVALGDERAPALFTRHLHTGVYFRVLEEGNISVGDHAEVAYRHPVALSVYRLFRACFDNTFNDAAEVLAVAATIPELAPEWQEKVVTGLARRQRG
ncbi:MOSC domain-containing protein [Pseudohalioglobus sediminis]|uniref:MOSC domain-containing protein n=1 Tax=Pseudohalioglobus sediminis TaxID=2606449 RepID=A0A5B0WLJ1_9GAMM|nr:MOSC domain-containing protein [Pseudohalioglobus sediminis]KAA1187944.1 MOSC domain-containing protein [Pseudohalioglobus sediminis]